MEKEFKFIVITQPHFFEGEAERITVMMQSGLQLLHLRKPGSTIEACRTLLQQIPACYHDRIVLHDHFSLLHEFGLHGVHLNSRNPEKPADWQGHVSISCHSIDELRELRKGAYDYISLSPIRPSVSKPGYGEEGIFNGGKLPGVLKEGMLDERVMALGGITRFNAKDMAEIGFGGGMSLGDAWQIDELPVVLSIAGSDSSAGAGVQQDLKTMTANGCYGTTAITALTAQNSQGISRILPGGSDILHEQISMVMKDLRVMAWKIGMIPNMEVARVIVERIRRHRQRQVLPVVYDPIMFSTSGTQLMDEKTIRYVVDNLFPLCTLITPNLSEYEHLKAIGCPPHRMLVKGGHGQGDVLKDTLYLPDMDKMIEFAQPRIETTNLHGTGCTLSSAIACGLAKGKSIEQAVKDAQHYTYEAIEGAKNLHICHGNGPLWHQ